MDSFTAISRCFAATNAARAFGLIGTTQSAGVRLGAVGVGTALAPPVGGEPIPLGAPQVGCLVLFANDVDRHRGDGVGPSAVAT